MLNNRVARVNSLIQQSVASIISERVRDDAIPTIFSIVSVDTTPDLSLARIYFSCIGTPDERQNAINHLKGAAGYIRGQMGKDLKLRKVPYLEFYLDNTPEYGQNIDNILRDIAKQAVADDTEKQ